MTEDQQRAVTQLVVEMRKHLCTPECKIEIVLNHVMRTITIEHGTDEPLVLTQEDQYSGRIQNLIRKYSNQIHDEPPVGAYVGV